MRSVNRQWLIEELPTGEISAENFRLREGPIPEVADGEVLLRNRFISLDPSMRVWLSGSPGYTTQARTGQVMRAGTISEVVESRTDRFVVGDMVEAWGGWQDYMAVPTSGRGAPQKVLPGFPPTLSTGILGGNGLTAYFGLLHAGEPQAGDVLLVSGAAGATGSVAGQIGRILGCRVIGLAGGPEKCAWVTEVAKFDAAIDYKSDDVDAKLAELAPDGVDIYFDNVGGPLLNTVLDHLAMKARVVICGAIAQYDTSQPQAGLPDLLRLSMTGSRVVGFSLLHYKDQSAKARPVLARWVQEGLIAYREDIVEGLVNAPAAFQRLFNGRNQGKQLLQLDD